MDAAGTTAQFDARDTGVLERVTAKTSSHRLRQHLLVRLTVFL